MHLSRAIIVLLFLTAELWCLQPSTVALASSEVEMVYKYEGSIQCRPGGTTMKDMEATLVGNGIKVRLSCKGHDGYLRPAVCGTPTGNINIYEIDADQLQKAIGLGFIVLSSQQIYKESCRTPNSSLRPTSALAHRRV
jgi:hypothetical protein